MQDRVAIAIVGSGPAGLSAAARAARRDVSHVLLEKTDHFADTIFQYQKGKHVMATPDALPLRSDLSFEAGTREVILQAWNSGGAELGIRVRSPAEVTAIQGEQGAFSLSLSDGGTLQAEHVVLAIGLQGNLRKLEIPGADWERVQYQLDDPEEYEDETIVVVGAGDAAIENAIALAGHNRVIIVNRRDEFARAKQGNLDAIQAAIESGGIECFYGSSPLRVEDATLVLKTPEGEAQVACDRIIARLGAIPPRAFVESCGIVFPSDDRTALPEVDRSYQSNVPGLYIIGALAGYPLIKQAMNQGYEVIESILGNPVPPADEPILQQKLVALPGTGVDEFLERIRRDVPLLSEINPLVLRELMLDSTVHAVQAGDPIFRRNDYSNTFFCIVTGEVAVAWNPDDPRQQARIGAGEFFGEMGLISGRRRSATVTASADGVLLEIGRRTMLKLIQSFRPVREALDRAALIRQLQTHLSPELPAEALREMAAHATIETFDVGQTLFRQGDPGDCLHVIRRGSVTVSRSIGGRDVVVSYVSAGNYVGEMALLWDEPRSATVRPAVNNTETVRLRGEDFRTLLEREPALRAAVEARARKRRWSNVDSEGREQAGSLIEFLVSQGLGEATDVLLIDESLCVACNQCESACAATHGGTSRLDRAAGPTLAQVHVPTSCRHCEHPHCMKDCPPDAIHRAPSGEVFIDDSCIGCGNCERNCPYGVIQMAPAEPVVQPGFLHWLLFGSKPGGAAASADPVKKVAVKCDMCRDLSGGPACVRSCPTGAATRVRPEEFLDIERMERRARS